MPGDMFHVHVNIVNNLRIIFYVTLLQLLHKKFKDAS